VDDEIDNLLNMGIFEVADEKLMLILKGMISKDKDNQKLIRLKI
jgi:hypothetical protein